MAEQLSFDLDFVSDPAANKLAGEQAAKQIRSGMGPGLTKVGKDLKDALSVNAKGAFNPVLDQLAKMEKAARAATAPIDSLETKLSDVIKRSKAFKDTLDSRGIDKNLFVSYDNALKDAIRFQAEFESRREEIARNPALRKTFERQAKDINQVLRTETQNASKFLQAEHGRQIVEQQRSLTLQNTANRLAGQKLIQDERQRSRTRIEIFRFTTRQILFFERQIAGALRGAVGIVGAGAGAIGGAISRLGQVFRRSNASLNDGLRGALIQREGALSRSFGRQTREVRSEVIKQSAVISRFQTQSSTGVVGALSGRSTIGAALGLGAGIGGGFALFQGLRNGVKVGGDFVQGLAVLQAQLKLTDKEMAGVRQQSIDLGNDILLPGVSALDAAEAIQILAKQFAALGSGALPAAQAAAKGVLQLSRAAGVAADEAARVVGAAVNVFGVDASKAVDVADQVTNALTKSAGVGFTEFADAFKQAAPVFKLFVGPAESSIDTLAEFNAALAVLAKGGLIGESAGTGLKQFFIQANRGTKDATEVLNAIVTQAKVTGTVFFDAEGNSRTFAATLGILREGLAGLNDQARNSSLQKLFGSRATTVASLLLNESAQGFSDLTQAILEQGSAAEIAAAQNTGLRGALDALKSVIETQQIKTYEKFQGVLGRVVLRFADLLNQFFEGKGVFGVIRGALAGLAAAFGALLIVKTATEGIKFLLIALTGLGSPLGVVVTAIGLLGAAIGALMSVSPEFRAEIVKIGDGLRAKLGARLGEIGGGLAKFAQFLRTEVVPRMVDFAVAVANRVVPAASAFADFIRRVMIPVIGALRETWNIFVHDDFTGVGPWQEDSPIVTALFRFRKIVTDTIGAVEEVWNIFVHRDFTGVGPWQEDSPIVTALFRFRDTVANIVGEVRGLFSSVFVGLPTLTPAKIVSTLGLAALGTLVGGPLGAAVGAAIGFAIGGLNLSRMGDRLIAALRPQLQRALDFIGNFLSGTAGTFGGAAGAAVKGFLLGPFQNAVEALGQFLGKLATDPRLLDALVKLAALGALTAANFLKGFLKGIITGAPGMLNQAAEIIDTAFNGALKQALSHPFQFAKIFALAFGGFELFKLFQRSGGEAGKGFLSGFGTRIATGATTQRRFLSAFFGGTAGLQAQADDVAKQSQKALQRAFERNNRDLTRLGQIGVLPTGFGDRPGVLVSQADVDLQKQRLDEVKGKFGEVATAGLIARAQLREGFRGLGDFFNDFSRGFASKGQAIGVTLGTGIVSGVGAALAGQQLGGATSAGGAAIGLAGVIGTALIPLLTIPGPVGLGLAGVTLAIGGIAAAIKATGGSADDSAPRVAAYVDVLKQFNSVAEAAPTLAAQITDTLLAQGTSVTGFLQQSGFNSREFADQVASGQDSLATSIRDLTRGLPIDQRRVQAFVDSELAIGANAQEAIDELDKAARGRTATPQATALISEITKGKADAKAFVDILKTLNEAGGDVQAAIDAAGVRKQLLAGSRGARGGLNDTTDAIENQRTAIETSNAALSIYIEQLTRAGEANKSTTGGFDAGIRLAERQKQRLDEVGQAVDLLNTKRTDAFNAQIQDVTTKLDAAREAASAAVEQVLELVTGDLFTGTQNAFDQLILQVPGIADALAQAKKDGLSLSEVDAQTFGGARLRNILQPFSEAIKATVAQGIKDGADTPEELAKLFEAAKAQIGTFTIPTEITAEDGTVTVQQVALPQEVKDFLLGQIQGFLDDPNLALALQQVVITEQAAQDLQARLDELGALLNVNVQFSEAQVRRALEELGLLATGALPGFENGFQKTPLGQPSVQSNAERNRAIIEAQRTAVVISRLPPDTQIASNAIPNVTFNTTQNIYETQHPRETAVEAARMLRAAAVSGRIPHVGANA